MRTVAVLFATVVASWIAFLINLPPRPSPWPTFATGVALILLTSHLVFRGHSGRWWGFVREYGDVHLLALVLVAALGVQMADAHGITTDGVIYFSQLRSVLFDGDLDVAREFAFLQQPPRPSHVVPIGPTFVWLPLYACVALTESVGRSLGVVESVSTDALGLTLPYVRAALLSSYSIGALGLFVLHGKLRREFQRTAAFAASLLIFAATPLVWYMVYEPSMTHAASFGFVAIFVVAATRLTSIDMARSASITLGALLGLAMLTRPQEAVFAMFPAILLLTARAPVDVRVRAAVRLALWAFVGALPIVLLQAWHTTTLLQRETFALVGGGGYLDFANSRWVDTLWSSWHGFFSWTPIAYLAFIALFFYVRRDRAWSIAAIVIVLTMAWINGSTTDWAAGWSFGGRRFTSTLVMLAPGVALMAYALIRRPLVAVAIAAVAAIAWQQLLLLQYSRGMLPADRPATFAQIVRQQATLATTSPFFYPFAFPANVIFAARTGLSIEDYDLLGAERPGSSFDVRFNDTADRFLREGWAGRVSDPFGELRWIDGERATLLVPLAAGDDQPITVRWVARTRRLDPPEPATFALLINGRETFRFTPDTEQPSTFEFAVPASAGVFSDGFNRVTFERRLGSPPVGIYSLSVGR